MICSRRNIKQGLYRRMLVLAPANAGGAVMSVAQVISATSPFACKPGESPERNHIPILQKGQTRPLSPTAQPDYNSSVGHHLPEPNRAHPNDSTHPSRRRRKAAKAPWYPCRKRCPRRRRRSPDRASDHSHTAPWRCACRADSRSSGRRQRSRSASRGGCVGGRDRSCRLRRFRDGRCWRTRRWRPRTLPSSVSC